MNLNGRVVTCLCIIFFTANGPFRSLYKRLLACGYLLVHYFLPRLQNSPFLLLYKSCRSRHVTPEFARAPHATFYMHVWVSPEWRSCNLYPRALLRITARERVLENPRQGFLWLFWKRFWLVHSRLPERWTCGVLSMRAPAWAYKGQEKLNQQSQPIFGFSESNKLLNF